MACGFDGHTAQAWPLVLCGFGRNALWPNGGESAAEFL
jgi:hypothetical protein